MNDFLSKRKKWITRRTIVVVILIMFMIFYFIYYNLQTYFVKTTDLQTIIINEYTIDSQIDLDEVNINISEVTETLGTNYIKRLHDYSQYLFKNVYYDHENGVSVSFIYIGGSKQSENYGRVTHIIYE